MLSVVQPQNLGLEPEPLSRLLRLAAQILGATGAGLGRQADGALQLLATHNPDALALANWQKAIQTEGRHRSFQPSKLVVVVSDPLSLAVWGARPIEPDPGQKAALADLLALALEIIELRRGQQRAEQARQENELQLRQLAENSQQLFWMTTPRSQQMLYVSPTCQQIWGFSPEQAYANPLQWLEHVHPDDQAMLWDALDAQCQGQATDLEYRLVHANGSVCWLRERAFPVRDASGQVYRVVGIATDISQTRALQEERRQAREALYESQRFIQRIAEATPNILYVYDLRQQRDVVYCNSRLRHTLGYSSEEIHRMGSALLTSVTHPEDLAQLLEYLGCFENLPDDAVTQRTFRMRHANGQWLWFSAQEAIFSRSPQGQPRQIIGIATDITEQRQMEAALRDREEQFRQIFELAPNGIAIADLDGRFLRANPAFCQVTGYGLAELQQRTVLDLTHPEDLAATLDQSDRLLQGAIDHSQMEKRYLHKDGHPIHVILRVTLVRDPQGQPLHYLSQILDITDRKQAELALAHSQEKYKTLFEILPLGILLTDHNGRILEANCASEQILGTAISQIKSRNIADPAWMLLGSDGRRLSPSDYIAAIALRENRTVADAEVCFAKPDGQRVWLSVTAAPIPLAGYGVVAAFTDITSRKQTEKQIQTALTEKEVLLREIHHRVKNNLQIISSLLRLQSESIRSQKYLRIFKEARSRIQSMSLIHEELYKSKDLSRIPLQEYLESLITNLFHSYGIDGDQVRATLSATGVQISIDEAVLCGLIINELVTNSLKYAFPKGRNGSVQVLLSQNRRTTTLRVSDDGVGMSTDFALHEAESLGLQLVSALTEQLEGKIELNRSTGTSFIITFPRVNP